VTDPPGDPVPKMPRDPAAADKAAQAEQGTTPADIAAQAKQSGDKPAQSQKGGSGGNGEGGGGGKPPPTTPPAAPVSDPSVIPSVAPVSDPRPQYGYDLTKYLLVVLGGTIILLWVYILTLDVIETTQVNDAYNRIIAAAEPTSNSPEIRRIDAVLETFNSLQRAPLRTFAPELKAETVESVRKIAHRLQPAQTINLNQCVQLMQPAENAQSTPPAASTPPQPSAPTAASQPQPPVQPLTEPASQSGLPAPSPQAQPQTAPAGPVPPGTQERTALVEICIKTLELVRYAVGGPMDTDRLRVMRDFAKDVHDNHQGLRTFWISATQLVLVNVLLPLLTALLGYIFGRQASGG
jgi:hypothetical protein